MKAQFNKRSFYLIFVILFTILLFQTDHRLFAADQKPNFEDASKLPVSPQIHPDRRVTLRLYAPKANEVWLVAGAIRDEVDGPVPMKKDDKDVWSITVGPLRPDVYDYGFSIDGTTRMVDPANPNVEELRWGHISFFEVPGDKPMYYEPKDVPHGELHQHFYKSDAIGETRRMFVYTPPGYDKSKNVKYPVLYLLHGGGQIEESWSWLGKVNFMMDNLLAEGKAEPMIIVMPYGHIKRQFMYGEIRKRELFVENLLDEIIPYIDKHHRTHTDADHRAIAGLSMGAGQSMSIGLKNLDTFSWIGMLSGGSNVENFEKEYPEILADPEKTNQKLKLFWMGRGKQERPERIMKFSEFLKSKKINHEVHISEYGHAWRTWRSYFYYELAPKLFKDN